MNLQATRVYEAGIKNRSQSFPYFQLVESPPTSSSISSSSSSYRNTMSLSTSSCHTENTTGSRRFHASNLGKPPGLIHNRNQIITKPLRKSTSNMTMTAPMKEIDKMITDLKKENFDLKLRLYHLKDMLATDWDLYQLKEENSRLKTSLEDTTRHMQKLEHELRLTNQKPASCSVGIQTEIPTFVTSPEAFGLKTAESWQKAVANDDNISSVMTALQNIKIIEDPVGSWLKNQLGEH